MIKKIFNLFKISCPSDVASDDPTKFKRVRFMTFLSATLGYAIYYVCRLSMNIVRKPIVDDGVFSESQLGIIGSCLFFVYAVGKLSNGFLADRCNARVFLATGLLGTALINLILGFTNMFVVFAVLWGLNGWFQSMGAPACVVSLNRWYNPSNRGTYYGFWSASHNLGEALTFITIALLVSWMGWRYGMIGAGLIGLAGFGMLLLFMRDTPQSQGFLLNEAATSPKSPKSQSEDFNKAQNGFWHWLQHLCISVDMPSTVGVYSTLRRKRATLRSTQASLYPSARYVASLELCSLALFPTVSSKEAVMSRRWCSG